MSSQLVVSEFNITTNADFQNEKYGITPELSRQFKKLHNACADKGNKKIIGKLLDLIEKHPLTPQLKNFLSVAYMTHNEIDKAYEVNHWIVTEHPDYLFGKTNLATEYIVKGETEKVPSILGDMMDLKSLYPHRNLFHLSEVTAFHQTVVLYYCAIDNLELAKNRLELMRKLAPFHEHTILTEEIFFNATHSANLKRWSRDEEDDFTITPLMNKKLPTSLNSVKPTFNHDVINFLYHFDLTIPHEKMKEIIELPRQSLIEDLEKILLDAEDRFQYFKEGNFTGGEKSFVLHSIFILKEINATGSLNCILSFLENDSEFLDFWLHDHIVETIWQAIYSLGLGNLDVLKQFLLKPGLNVNGKLPVSTTLCEIAKHHPEKRNHIVEIYREVLNAFNSATPDDNLVDTEFLSLVVNDITECHLPELLPQIKSLFEKDYIDSWISGDFNEVAVEFELIDKADEGNEIFNIYELYNDVVESWAGYTNDENDNEFDDEFNDDDSPLSTSLDNYEELDSYNPRPIEQAVSTKVNRNDPCPCGSGKKYKKCHGVND